jgi:hypothetical protein
MKIIFVSFTALLIACSTETGGDFCVDDHCVCPSDTACVHTCADGAPECHVQGMSPEVDITCDHNGECHVECSQAASCEVECGDSAECEVTCPAGGCTVTGCDPDNGCTVACGGGIATHTGTTATCP